MNGLRKEQPSRSVSGAGAIVAFGMQDRLPHQAGRQCTPGVKPGPFARGVENV